MANKVYQRIMGGEQDSNIKFADLQYILSKVNFRCRIKGDHYIYTREDVEEIINIQPNGNKAKPYQVKQVRYIFLKYNI